MSTTQKLDVNVYKAKNLPLVQEMGKQEAWIEVMFENTRSVIQAPKESKEFAKAVNPVFNTTITFEVKNVETARLEIVVHDFDASGNDVIIGCVKIRLTNLTRNMESTFWYKLANPNTSLSEGEISLGLTTNFDTPLEGTPTSSTNNQSRVMNQSSSMKPPVIQNPSSFSSDKNFMKGSGNVMAPLPALSPSPSSYQQPSSHMIPKSNYVPRSIVPYNPKDIKRDLPHIAQGSFGLVYTGKVPGIDEKVVIKDMSCSSQKAYTDWQREIEMMSKVNSKNIVAVLGYCNDGKTLTIVMEYMQKGSLYDVLHKRKEKLNVIQRMRMAKHVAAGLESLHANSVMHRDIKSMNILVTSDYSCKLTDFGCAKMVDDNKIFQTANSGTPLWMAPEVKQGVYSFPADIYSLGLVLYELLEHKLPTYDQIGGKVILPHSYDSFEIVNPCLSINPKNRPPAPYLREIIEKKLATMLHAVLMNMNDSERSRFGITKIFSTSNPPTEEDVRTLYETFLRSESPDVDAIIYRAFGADVKQASFQKADPPAPMHAAAPFPMPGPFPYAPAPFMPVPMAMPPPGFPPTGFGVPPGYGGYQYQVPPPQSHQQPRQHHSPAQTPHSNPYIAAPHNAHKSSHNPYQLYQQPYDQRNPVTPNSYARNAPYAVPVGGNHNSGYPPQQSPHQHHNQPQKQPVPSPAVNQEPVSEVPIPAVNNPYHMPYVGPSSASPSPPAQQQSESKPAQAVGILIDDMYEGNSPAVDVVQHDPQASYANNSRTDLNNSAGKTNISFEFKIDHTNDSSTPSIGMKELKPLANPFIAANNPTADPYASSSAASPNPYEVKRNSSSAPSSNNRGTLIDLGDLELNPSIPSLSPTPNQPSSDTLQSPVSESLIPESSYSARNPRQFDGFGSEPLLPSDNSPKSSTPNPSNFDFSVKPLAPTAVVHEKQKVVLSPGPVAASVPTGMSPNSFYPSSSPVAAAVPSGPLYPALEANSSPPYASQHSNTNYDKLSDSVIREILHKHNIPDVDSLDRNGLLNKLGMVTSAASSGNSSTTKQLPTTSSVSITKKMPPPEEIQKVRQAVNDLSDSTGKLETSVAKDILVNLFAQHSISDMEFRNLFEKYQNQFIGSTCSEELVATIFCNIWSDLH